MDPFYLGIPAGPPIPPVERTGLQRITRDQPHDQPRQPRQQAEEEELEEDEDLEELEELEALETYDDHGHLHGHPQPHELEAGDGGLPAPEDHAGRLSPVRAEQAASASEPPAPVPGDRRHKGDDGHIDISV